jgi:hypothetical protein
MNEFAVMGPINDCYSFFIQVWIRLLTTIDVIQVTPFVPANSVLPGMLRMDEDWSVGLLSGPILSAVHVIGVFTIAKGIASGLFGAPRNASEIT